MRRIRISVTQEDIDKGIKSSYQRCAISLAAKRKFNDDRISTGTDVILIFGKQYQLSPRAIQFVKDFDLHHKNVKPSTFVLKETPF